MRNAVARLTSVPGLLDMPVDGGTVRRVLILLLAAYTFGNIAAARWKDAHAISVPDTASPQTTIT